MGHVRYIRLYRRPSALSPGSPSFYIVRYIGLCTALQPSSLLPHNVWKEGHRARGGNMTHWGQPGTRRLY